MTRAETLAGLHLSEWELSLRSILRDGVLNMLGREGFKFEVDAFSLTRRDNVVRKVRKVHIINECRQLHDTG